MHAIGGADGQQGLHFLATVDVRQESFAATVLFGLKLADNIHYKFKSSQASKARLQSSKHTGAEFNAKWQFKVIRVLESGERR